MTEGQRQHRRAHPDVDQVRLSLQEEGARHTPDVAAIMGRVERARVERIRSSPSGRSGLLGVGGRQPRGQLDRLGRLSLLSLLGPLAVAAAAASLIIMVVTLRPPPSDPGVPASGTAAVDPSGPRNGADEGNLSPPSTLGLGTATVPPPPTQGEASGYSPIASMPAGGGATSAEGSSPGRGPTVGTSAGQGRPAPGPGAGNAGPTTVPGAGPTAGQSPVPTTSPDLLSSPVISVVPLGAERAIGLSLIDDRDWIAASSRRHGSLVRAKSGSGEIVEVSGQVSGKVVKPMVSAGPLRVSWSDGEPEQNRRNVSTWWTVPPSGSLRVEVRLARQGRIDLYVGAPYGAVSLSATRSHPSAGEVTVTGAIEASAAVMVSVMLPDAVAGEVVTLWLGGKDAAGVAIAAVAVR